MGENNNDDQMIDDSRDNDTDAINKKLEKKKRERKKSSDHTTIDDSNHKNGNGKDVEKVRKKKKKKKKKPKDPRMIRDEGNRKKEKKKRSTYDESSTSIQKNVIKTEQSEAGKDAVVTREGNTKQQQQQPKDPKTKKDTKQGLAVPVVGGVKKNTKEKPKKSSKQSNENGILNDDVDDVLIPTLMSPAVITGHSNDDDDTKQKNNKKKSKKKKKKKRKKKKKKQHKIEEKAKETSGNNNSNKLSTNKNKNKPSSLSGKLDEADDVDLWGHYHDPNTSSLKLSTTNENSNDNEGSTRSNITSDVEEHRLEGETDTSNGVRENRWMTMMKRKNMIDDDESLDNDESTEYAPVERIKLNHMPRTTQSINRESCYFSSLTTYGFIDDKQSLSGKFERIEAFLYNHGMTCVLGIMFLAMNILAASHGIYQFTPMGGYVTTNPILRVTLPIARAGGRLVTVNSGFLLLTACKSFWTWLMNASKQLPIGFPFDHIMPQYHRCIALVIIFMGCIMHTIPQIVNYATKSLTINTNNDDGGGGNNDGKIVIWTFGNGLATKQLLITGLMLTFVFTVFFVTTLKSVRQKLSHWLAIHITCMALMYSLLIIHGTYKGSPIFLVVVIVPLIIYIIDSATRKTTVWTSKVISWKAYEEDGDKITELVVECPLNFHYFPGQYCELQFKPISSYEWRPFTIIWCPPHETVVLDERSQLKFCIKAVGDWTGKLYNLASAFDLSKAAIPTEISIRGPHGAPAQNFFNYKHIIVIGSGIGVTPLLSIWRFLVDKGHSMVKTERFLRRRNSMQILRRDSFKSLSHMLPDDYQQCRTAMLRNTSMKMLQGTSSRGLGSSVHGTGLSMRRMDSMKDLLSEMMNDIDDEEPEESSTTISQEQHDHEESKFYLFWVKVENILWSLTAAICILVLFISGETIIILTRMIGYSNASNVMQALLACLTLLIHIAISIASTVTLHGFGYYLLSFKCKIECLIILVDALVLWKSVRDINDNGDNGKIGSSANVLVILFGVTLVILHIIRVSHIFWLTLNDDSSTCQAQEHVLSIQGILISRKYSGMRFCLNSLLEPLEEGFSTVFSLSFYGTREKEDFDEYAVTTTSSKSIQSKNDSKNICYYAGRPNWELIMKQAITKAHLSDPSGCGETIGLFFCGSPAIALDLRRTAAKVTACHKYSTKKHDSSTCNCKFVIHTENFG